MSVRMIVCDIDDTLLPQGYRNVSDENLEALRAAQEANIAVTLATGRFYAAARTRVEELGIRLPVIAANGSDIRMNGKTVQSWSIDPQVVEGIVRYAKEHGFTKYLFCGDDILCMPEDENPVLFDKWKASGAGENPVTYKNTVEELLEAAADRTGKILLWAPDEQAQQEALRDFEVWKDRALVVCGEPPNLEVNAAGVSKGSAMRAVCAMLGLDPKDTMAIGDSENDADMLKDAGIGIAVANAMPAAKEAADHVVASCEQNGVAQAIQQYALTEGTSNPG